MGQHLSPGKQLQRAGWAPEPGVGGTTMPVEMMLEEPGHHVAEKTAYLRRSVPTAAASAAVVRHLVSAVALECRVPARWLDELVLAVNEAFSNAVRHGTGTPSDDTHVTVEAERDGIMVELRYRGEPFDTRIRELPADIFHLGGRGRYLMQHLLDHEEYRFSNGNTVLRMFKQF